MSELYYVCYFFLSLNFYYFCFRIFRIVDNHLRRVLKITKRVIRFHKSQKDRHHNGQTKNGKKTNDDILYIHNQFCFNFFNVIRYDIYILLYFLKFGLLQKNRFCHAASTMDVSRVIFRRNVFQQVRRMVCRVILDYLCTSINIRE